MPLMAELSWAEIADYLAHDDRVILPLGATEEHGPHLGLGTDSLEAHAIARAAGDVSGVLVAPVLAYGQSQGLMGFAGTLSLRPATLQAVIEDLLRALYKHGFRRVLVVNGHGGNTASLSSAIETVAAELVDLRIKHFAWWMDPESSRVISDTMGPQAGSHAADGETALMLAVCPQGVKLEKLTGRNAPVLPSREVTTVQTFAQRYPDGIMGNHPAHATREAGETILKSSVEICVRELNNWPV